MLREQAARHFVELGDDEEVDLPVAISKLPNQSSRLMSKILKISNVADFLATLKDIAKVNQYFMQPLESKKEM